MRRLALLLLATPALAADPQTLRLACRPDQPAMGAPLAFSIDLAAQAATETTGGKRFTVAERQDSLVLSDGGTPMWRIDRLTGRFTRLDTQLRLEGVCDKVERKF